MKELEVKVKKMVYITIGLATFFAFLASMPYLNGTA